MIESMTGFGKAVVESTTRKITFEIKSLNSKQMDLAMRLPSGLRDLEIELRGTISSRLGRGKVDVIVTYETLSAESASKLNMSVLSDYKAQITKASEEFRVNVPQDWFSVLLKMPDAMKTEVAVLSEDDINAVNSACEKAIDSLLDFRLQEGKKLEIFFREKIAAISRLLEDVEPFESCRVAKIRQRLEDQLAKISGIEFDRGRLEQELIFYIEKLDVTEEKTRLHSHLAYFIQTLDEAPGQGKKLGFIAQEMGREINTLGSKSNDAEMQKIVVKMKDELEQIKEQVLNVL